jgi:nucleolar protein 14
LIALVKLNPITAAGHFIGKVSLMQKNLTRGLARGATQPDSKTYPGAAELVILRLIGTIWSTSDFSHPVVAPTVLLMGQYLSHGRMRKTSDIASGLMLCSLLVQVGALSLYRPSLTNSLNPSRSDSYRKRSTSLPAAFSLSYLDERTVT